MKKTFYPISKIMVFNKDYCEPIEHSICSSGSRRVLVDINRNRIKIKVEGGEKIILPPDKTNIRQLMTRELVFMKGGEDEMGYDAYDHYMRWLYSPAQP